jgi:ABC-type multidrug transport system ATPase subunit
MSAAAEPREVQPALEARSLSRAFPFGRGFSDISFAVSPGSSLLLMGPNGSGKSTLLSVLSTAEPPTGGSLTWFGVTDPRSPAVRRRIGFLADTAVHFDHLSGWENAVFFGAQYGVAQKVAKGRLQELFAWAGLADAAGYPVAEYSLGMRRRLSLIETLCHQPALLLLDEPTLGLDHIGCLDLVEQLHLAAADGAAVLVSTNDLSLAQRLGGEVRFLHQGREVRRLSSPGSDLGAVFRSLYGSGSAEAA